jgi:prepilin-type processing-associated H-X9-DG protein
MPFLSWSARILPHLEQQPLWDKTYQAFGREPEFARNPPHVGLNTVLSVYLCPADGRAAAHIDPEDIDVALTNYLGVANSGRSPWDGLLFLESRVRLAEVTDGTANSVMVGERPPGPDESGQLRFGWWYGGVGQDGDGSADLLLGARERCRTFRTPTCPIGPYRYGPGRLDYPCDMFHFWSRHPGGGHFAFADGSVRLLRYTADDILPALASRAGGESVTIPD